MAINEKVNIELTSKKTGTGFKDLNKEINDTSKNLDSVKTSLLNFGVIAGGLALAGLTKFVSQSIILGKELKVLQDNFQGSSKDIELFKKATAGTVSEGSLIKLSNYASDLGVSLKDQALLFSLAEDAADKYGGGVESNFERVIAATDGSARGLRSIGIAVKDYDKELEKLTKTQGINIDNLEADEQLQIRLQAIYNLTGVSIESVNEKMQDEADVLDSIGVAVTDIISKFGEGLVGSMKLTGDESVRLKGLLEDLSKAALSMGQDVGNFFSSILSGIQSSAKEAADWLDEMYEKEHPGFMFEKSNARVEKRLKELEDADVQKLLGEMQPSKEEFLKNKDKSILSPKGKTGSPKTDKVIKENKEEIAKALLLSIKNEILASANIPTEVQSNVMESGLTDPYSMLGIRDFQLLYGDTEEKKTGMDLEKTYDTSTAIVSNLNQLFGLLDTGTNKFITDMLTFFRTLMGIAEGISIVRSIIGIATGGIGGLPAGGGGGVSPVYINANLNGLTFMKANMPKYNRNRNYTRIS